MYNFLTGFYRPIKRAIFFASGLFFLLVGLYVAYALRFGTPTPVNYIGDSWVLFPLLALVYVPLVLTLRLPSIKLNAFESGAVIRIGILAIGLSVAAMTLSYLLGLGTPRSVPIIFGGAVFLGSAGTRSLAQLFLQRLHYGNTRAIPVAVYGAGAAGIQLVSALRRSREVKPVIFIDDNSTLHGLLIAGLEVKSPEALSVLAANGRIERVLLAIPSISPHRRNILVEKLSELSLEVQALPSYVELLLGNEIENSLRKVSPNELLGREKVNLDNSDIAKSYAGRTVMVTGAGGSIGSELCRQLIDRNPAKVVLFEQNEFGLYAIDHELREAAAQSGIEVIARLGSITNEPRFRGVMKSEGVEVVLHAAAYKHVPLVEDSELEGARNNVVGTQIVAEAAVDLGVERFILISTDKAVRPTNIMGATKRMAEIVVQDLHTRSQATKLSMVRFGNVLGSSGSVLPLFQRQIQKGPDNGYTPRRDPFLYDNP